MAPEDTALVVKAIPALSYARFNHKGSVSDLSLALDYVYGTWWPKSSTELLWSLVLEHYGQDWRSAAQEEAETEIYIPLR
jgi:predicted transcriptional regulator YdeE